MAYLKLTRAALAAETSPLGAQQQVWPLRVTAEALQSGELPAAIFVYQITQEEADLFVGIATLPQIAETPSTQPEASSALVYYRQPVLEFHCRSEEEVEDLWARVQIDAAELVLNYEASKILNDEEVVEF